MTSVEFRDGVIDVPDHVALMMRGMRTWEMTYEQARGLADQNILRQRLDIAQRELVNRHFKTHGDR
jgi:hypothetical protein